MSCNVQQKCSQKKFEDLITLRSSKGNSFLHIRKVFGSNLSIRQTTSTEFLWFSSTSLLELSSMTSNYITTDSVHLFLK